MLLAAMAVTVVTVWAVSGPRLAESVQRLWCRLDGCHPTATAAGGRDPWDSPDPLVRATWGRIAILGDSFASGEGNGNYRSLGSPERCHASASAHGRVMAGDLGAAGRTTFAACSGAKIRDLSKREGGRPSQLDQLTADTSLVTASIGGNDLDWAATLQTCVFAPGNCRPGTDLDEIVRSRITAMGPTLERAYAQIRARAPHARILVTGYPRFFPANPTDDYTQLFGALTLFDTATQAWANRHGAEFNQVIARAARSSGVEYVEMTDAFDRHELTTSAPWYHGIEYRRGLPVTESGSFHPNEAGQARMARLVEAQIRHPVR